ncbi:hypothetical protein [Shouchella lonarensis]|uniref:Uncharacterized protein n=1 Tax=Shouchella lonarensis TaxID=1464122 RepID=A0A1G6N1S5_9BACI|nr:hypothetical protein [Shouchella lonarensis]SDC61763.1 hypothetical protein SAMN05421737_11175 [Shouchella lonarensis]
MEWQDVTVRACRHEKKEGVTTRHSEFYSVFRVLYQQRLGSFMYSHKNNDPMKKIEGAIRDALGKGEEGDYHFKKFDREISICNGVNPLKLSTKEEYNYLEIDLTVESKKSYQLKQRTILDYSESVVEKSLLLESHSFNEKYLFEMPWLITPVCLSKLTLGDWCSNLKQHNVNVCIPRDISIEDRAINMLYDLEGNRKRPVEFIRDGKIINLPQNLSTAGGCSSLLTGHGGLTDIFLTDLYLSSDNKGDLPYQGYFIVIDAHKVSTNVFVLSFCSNSRNANREIDILVSFNPDMLFRTDYYWIDERAKGVFPWDLPYLLIVSPAELGMKLL